MTVGGTLYCIDLWVTVSKEGLKIHPELEDKPENVLSKFMSNLALEVVMGRVKPLKMLAQHAAGVVSKILEGRKLDMLFIDGDHTYEGVRDNVRDFRPLIAKGGLLCGHDWNHAGWPGVVKAVIEFVPGYTVVPGTSIWMVQV